MSDAETPEAAQEVTQAENTAKEKTPKNREPYTDTFWGGVFFGAALGGFLGLWYAPASGEESLNRISRQVSEVKNALLERVRGESIEASLQEGRALAHQHRAHSAQRLDKPRS